MLGYKPLGFVALETTARHQILALDISCFLRQHYLVQVLWVFLSAVAHPREIEDNIVLISNNARW